MSWPCQQADDAADVGDEQPCFGAGDGFLPVLRHPTAASEPCECALDHPSSGNDFKALRGVGTLDDLQGPAPEFLQCPAQLWPSVAAIGEDMTQQRIGRCDGFQHLRRAVTILNIGPVHDKADQKTDGVGDDVTLATLDPFPAS